MEFRGKCLFSEFDGSLKSLSDPGLLCLIHVGVQSQKIVRRFDGWVRDFQIKQAVECLGIVAGAKKRAQPPLGLCFDLVVLAGEFTGGFLKLLPVLNHPGVELRQLVLLEKPDARLWKGERFKPPVARSLTANPGDVPAGGVSGVEDELAGREQIPVGLKRPGGCCALLRGQGSF